MFFKKQIAIFVLVFSFMIMLGVGLYAHRLHDVKKIDLSFTSLPQITCNIDGDTFTHKRVTDANGNTAQDWWYKIPKDPEVKIEAKSHGFGYAHILFYGNIDGKPKGDANNTKPDQLGSWIGFLPLGYGAPEETIELAFDDPFNRDEKEYTWNASGSIKLVPYYWKWGLSGIIPSGSWEPAPSEFHNTQDASGPTSGSWTVEHNHSTLTQNRVPIGGSDSTDTTDTTTTTDTSSTTDDDSSSTSPYSLSASSTGSPFQAGDTVTLTLSGNESIYSVDWSLVSPQYTSSSPLSSDYKGESGQYDSSVSYTFPSGYQGDFVFTAVVYTHGNMTRYEHTYTITVQ